MSPDEKEPSTMPTSTMQRKTDSPAAPARKGSTEATARRQKMINDYVGGMSLDEVGAKYGVSRQRVHQIIGKGHADESAKAAAERAAKEETELVEKISEWLLRHVGATYQEVSEAFDVSVDKLKTLPLPHTYMTFSTRSREQRWSVEDIRAALKNAAGDKPTITQAEYRSATVGNPDVPSSGLIAARYDGSWAKALRDAGLKATKSHRAEYRRKWSSKDMVSIVREFISETGSRSSTDYDAWSRDHAERPSLARIRQVAGTWTEVAGAAVNQMAKEARAERAAERKAAREAKAAS